MNPSDKFQDLKAQLAELKHSDESAKQQVETLMKRLQEEKEFYSMNRDAMRAELESYKVLCGIGLSFEGLTR